MGIYIFQHPETKEVKEVFQSMNDEHVYVEDGVKWDRIYTVPQASIDTQIDPFNQQQYIEKTGSKKGTIGDAWDRSKELSEKRAAKAGGVDPVKAEYYKKYSEKRKGKPHPKQIAESVKNITI